MAKKPDDLIPVAEAAEIIGVTPQRARVYIDEGRLAAVRVGRSYVVKRGDAAAFKRRGAGRPKAATQ